MSRGTMFVALAGIALVGGITFGIISFVDDDPATVGMANTLLVASLAFQAHAQVCWLRADLERVTAGREVS